METYIANTASPVCAAPARVAPLVPHAPPDAISSPYLEGMDYYPPGSAQDMDPAPRVSALYDIPALTRAVEKLCRKDPAASLLLYATGEGAPLREACARARVAVLIGRNAIQISVTGGYYSLAATTLGVCGLLPLVESMVRGVLNGYLAWSTDDAALMRLRVPDALLCDAIMSRVRAPDQDGMRSSPVLEAAGISPDVTSMRDLTWWLVSPTHRLVAPGAPAIFGGRLAKATGHTLARETETVRIGNLAPGTFAAPPELIAAQNTVVHLVRSIHPRDILRLIGWPDAEPAPADVVPLVPSGDAAFWDRLRSFVDDAIVPYMPGGKGALIGCASLARSGLVPRLSQLFPVDFCIVSSHGLPCLFVAVRPMDQVMWKNAFEAVGSRCPFSSLPVSSPAVSVPDGAWA
ncbi:hypothetical protein pneo_cds_220 [Pandoravirus neocaledonia]|uniref:Uncharacterized protein n=1 Tax=Pandoravirus neocaledonia TaxID=2107708 RepID=A0A2U7UBK0_9VIRU|nr:hypothetical protein pneo_cds_220 [Pandoravirus neocaledonia]AVK75827.1 hypothetical protein pneo_cds_220 [Pandoravirus neocaledonia]